MVFWGCRIIVFWAKLKFGNQLKLSSLLCHVMSRLHSWEESGSNFKWIKFVKENLDHTGFGWVWNASDINVEAFKSSFKQRCHDIFIQKWQAEVHSNSQCNVYKFFKREHGIEDFIKKIEPAHAYNLIKFRTRTHHLPISKSRFNEDANVKCDLCNSDERGDELHYLFKCAYFSELRRKYLPHNFLIYADHEKCRELFSLNKNILIQFNFNRKQ